MYIGSVVTIHLYTAVAIASTKELLKNLFVQEKNWYAQTYERNDNLHKAV